MSLKDKRIVIIGGSSGIGMAVAEGALKEGARVTVSSSKQATVDKGLSHLKGAEGIVADVKDEAQLEKLFARVGAFDHLVYTAGDWGGPRRGALESIDIKEAQSVFAVRFWGALAAVKQAKKHLAANGSVTLTDGMIAHRPSKGSVVSTGMAGAVEHMTRALAVELAPIRVNAVCPGAIRTEVWNILLPEAQREGAMRQMGERVPLKRIGEPGEVAEAYLYLMRGGFTTGQVLSVDGGQSVV